jgi:sec-independent protein translocase protein TatC
MVAVFRRRKRPQDGSMTMVEHLTELRTRLIISVVAVAVASIIGFIFYDDILRLLTRPYKTALEQLPPDARPEGALGEGDLVYSSPVDPFLTVLKIGFFSGLLLALPVVLWQLWRYVTPALTKRERRLGIPFVLCSVLLFAGGTAFALAIIPRGLRFLIGFGGTELIPLLTVDKYLGFLTFLILAFGLSFEFPLLLIFLAGVRVVTSTQMRRWRKYAYFGIAVFAAIATPTQDPYTMLLMTAPLMLFYEGAILVARAFKR